MQPTTIVDIGKIDETQLREHREDRGDRKHPVGVEADALATDRRGKIKFAAGRDDALQFARGAAGAIGVEPIAVTPESDVLDHVQAGHAE